MHRSHAGATDQLFFFNDTATTEIYTLSLHDALPISRRHQSGAALPRARATARPAARAGPGLRRAQRRSEEHTSELQSRQYLVCRLLLEKKSNPAARTICCWETPRASRTSLTLSVKAC